MSQMRRIDLNSDLGEGFGPWSIGDDAAMMDLATSANVPSGGHAGDPETMFVTLSFAAQRGVVRGASWLRRPGRLRSQGDSDVRRRNRAHGRSTGRRVDGDLVRTPRWVS